MVRTGIPASEWMEDFAMTLTVIGLLNESDRPEPEPPAATMMSRGTL